MTRRELIQRLVEVYPHFSRDDAEVMVHSVFDSMAETLRRGDRIEIRGFGSFVVKQRRAREGKNPKSGRMISVAARRVPFFKVGKELKLRVDGSEVDIDSASDDDSDE